MRFNENVLERLEHIEDQLVQLRRRIRALEGTTERDCMCEGPYEECEICMGV